MISMTSMIELESQFGPSFDEYFNGENQVVSKSSDVTTADASDKRQQQPNSTSSTSTLATTVSADRNFDLWVPIGKILTSSTSKADSESTHGLNVDIPNIQECKQTLDLSAGTSINVQKEQSFDLSAVTTADASVKRQQQPDSTSSTSTLSTIVTTDGNFDLWLRLGIGAMIQPEPEGSTHGHSIVRIEVLRYKHRCCSPIPAKSDSSPHAHTQALEVNNSASRLLILNFLKELQSQIKNRILGRLLALWSYKSNKNAISMSMSDKGTR
ncbi:hypothetical protein Tco_0228347 [Tanacetum coccineum]